MNGRAATPQSAIVWLASLIWSLIEQKALLKQNRKRVALCARVLGPIGLCLSAWLVRSVSSLPSSAVETTRADHCLDQTHSLHWHRQSTQHHGLLTIVPAASPSPPLDTWSAHTQPPRAAAARVPLCAHEEKRKWAKLHRDRKEPGVEGVSAAVLPDLSPPELVQKVARLLWDFDRKSLAFR